jgi:hypothetical protein
MSGGWSGATFVHFHIINSYEDISKETQGALGPLDGLLLGCLWEVPLQLDDLRLAAQGPQNRRDEIIILLPNHEIGAHRGEVLRARAGYDPHIFRSCDFSLGSDNTTSLQCWKVLQA